MNSSGVPKEKQSDKPLPGSRHHGVQMSPSNLSLRSTKQPPGQPNLTAKAIADAWKDLYSEDNNPNGVINLGVAENSLMQEFLVEKLKESISRFEARHLNYQSLGGSSSFKEAMCHILNKYFNPFASVKPEHLISASGVTAILAQLMYAVCDEGDGVLISKPYYSGFNHLVKQGVHLIGFEIEDPLDPRSVSQALDQIYLNHHGQPHRIKSVILCNPHNPMGYYVQEEVLSTYVRFCEANGLHLIVDEIYGLSVFDEGPTTDNDDPAPQKVPGKFISALSLNPRRHSFHPSRLHILYGISKGVLISQNNSDLLRLITDLNLNQVQVSSLTEFSFSNLILNNSDHPDHQEFLESYIIESKKRLLKAHQTVTEKLKELKIDYNNPSNGGFFLVEYIKLMIDLSRYLSKPTDLNNKDKETDGGSRTEEEKLFQILLKEYKIYMAPGNVYNYPKPGFFRLTFTVPPNHLDLGLQRLARFMESYETLPPMSNLQISR